MKRALRLAEKGVGKVSPNPAVGAVIVQNGEIVGEGYHLWEKVLHAEIIALREAGTRAKGAEMYVTLEPCSHHGRTPPCADAILASGIRRVFVAVEDPDPRVSGRGIARLMRGGVEVRVGLCGEEASGINEPFFFAVTHHRPMITLKLAMSVDGRIATQHGESQWITGTESREYVHRLRFEHDAVLVGSGTLRADNPRLDIRKGRKKQITRVILDSSGCCLKPGMRLLSGGGPILVYHDQEKEPSSFGWEAGPVQYQGVPKVDGLLSWVEILSDLFGRGIRSILVEGGGRIAASLIDQRFVDKLYLFYSPMIIGADGLSGIGALRIPSLADAFRFEVVRIFRRGSDFCVQGKVSSSRKIEDS